MCDHTVTSRPILSGGKQTSSYCGLLDVGRKSRDLLKQQRKFKIEGEGVAQPVKVLATGPSDLSLTLDIYTVKGEN